MTTISRGRYALIQDGGQAHLTLVPDDGYGPPQTHTIPAAIWRMLQGMADGTGRMSPAALVRALRPGGGS